MKRGEIEPPPSFACQEIRGKRLPPMFPSDTKTPGVPADCGKSGKHCFVILIASAIKWETCLWETADEIGEREREANSVCL